MESDAASIAAGVLTIAFTGAVRVGVVLLRGGTSSLAANGRAIGGLLIGVGAVVVVLGVLNSTSPDAPALIGLALAILSAFVLLAVMRSRSA